MKILHLIDSAGFYGAERVVVDLMLEQRDFGHEPVLASLNSHSSKKKAIEEKALSYNLPVKIFRLLNGPDFISFKKVLKYSKENNIDIFHCHGYKPNILTAAIPRSIRKAPAISTIHGWTNTRLVSKMTAYEWLDRKLLRFMDAVILVNKNMLSHKHIINSKIDKNRLHVVNNGIRPGKINHPVDSNPVRQTIDKFKGANLLIGAVGRLSREKGFAYLIDSFVKLSRNNDNIKLVIIGDGPLKNDLNDRVMRAGIPEKVLFTGYIDSAMDYFDLFDMYVISSLTEGLPITLLEAMSLGIPIVSTNVGGIPDVVEHARSALLVEKENADSLTLALSDLINNQALKQQLSNAAKETFKSNHSSKVMAKKYDAIYQSVLNRI